MIVWVIYDITDDKIRSKVARACKDMGLYRVQKSAFCGTLNRNQLDELKILLEELVTNNTDSIFIFPLCDKDFRRIILIGEGFDRDLISNRKITEFV